MGLGSGSGGGLFGGGFGAKPGAAGQVAAAGGDAGKAGGSSFFGGKGSQKKPAILVDFRKIYKDIVDEVRRPFRFALMDN